VIDAGAHTMITRKVSASFDQSPIGQRRRRTMIEGLQRLEQAVLRDCAGRPAEAAGLDAIATAVAQDYLRFRFGQEAWLTATPALDAWLAQARLRPSYASTQPR
jgi:glutathione S-transferase